MPGMFDRFKAVYDILRHNLRVYAIAMRDPRTPRVARWLLWAAIAYLISPIDIIPDFIPVIGHLDDVIIVPALFLMARWMIPPVVMQDAHVAAERLRRVRQSRRNT
jgi:uncharacterized membrane protein YkvA (DUF1232 family)